MAEILPAILPKNYDDLKNKISLMHGIVDFVQIDLCDGIFVKSTTWPFLGKANNTEFLDNDLDLHFRRIVNEEEGMPCWDSLDFELDLMVHDAVQNFDIYTKLGPKRVIFHMGAVGDIEEFKNFLEGIDSYIKDAIQIGVAVNPRERVEEVFPLVPFVDCVQVMGIDYEGAQGEDFDPKCLDQIKKLKEKFPGIIISVDGSVNFETAQSLIDAGADRLIIGSAIFNSEDVIDAIERFRSL